MPKLMKAIKISEDLYVKLNKICGQLQAANGTERKTINDAIRHLIDESEVAE